MNKKFKSYANKVLWTYLVIIILYVTWFGWINSYGLGYLLPYAMLFAGIINGIKNVYRKIRKKR